MLASLPLFVLALSGSALALDLRGHIRWNEHCSGIAELGQAKVLLDDGKWKGGITRDGGFTIPDVPSGTYILSVLAHDHAFDQLRIDVHETDGLPEVRPYVPGTPLSPASPVSLPYPITLSATQRLDYYTQQQAFDIIAMFKNPMMLMMVFGGVMVFAMPYLMKNMDPEMLKDFEERHAKITNIQNSLQSGDIKSGISALMSAADEEAAASTGKQVGETKPKQRSGKNKKR